VPVEAVRVADSEDRLSERTRCLLRTTSAYRLSPNAIEIEIKPTLSPKTVPPPIHTRTHNEHTESQVVYPLPDRYSVPLINGNRHRHANATFLFSFFQFSIEAQSPQLPSKEDTSSVGKVGGAAKVSLRCHIGVYCTGHKTHCDKLPTSHFLLMA